MIMSEDDKRKLEAFKNRTVQNGSTVAEEKAAKKKIEEIMDKYKSSSNMGQSFNTINDQIIDEFFKNRNQGGTQQKPPNPYTYDIFSDFLNRHNKKPKDEYKKENNNIVCPNCKHDKFYTYKDKLFPRNYKPLCGHCYNILETLPIVNPHGYYTYTSYELCDLEELDKYNIDIYLFSIVERKIYKKLAKYSPINVRLKFFININKIRLEKLFINIFIKNKK